MLLKLIYTTLPAIFQPRSTRDILQIKRTICRSVFQDVFMYNSVWSRLGRKQTPKDPRSIKRNLQAIVIGLAAVGCIGNISPQLLASDDVIAGSVRVQLLSDSLVRLELKGAEGFEDRNPFHVSAFVYCRNNLAVFPPKCRMIDYAAALSNIENLRALRNDI
jgi:hypothetical protein